MHISPSREAAPPAEDFSLFAARRERLLQRVGGGVVLLPAASEVVTSRSTEVRYRAHTDLYYLTGFREPGALALLTPHDPEHRFTLFVRPRDAAREQWEGRRAGVEGAREIFGADAAYPIDELEDRLHALVEPADRLIYALGSHRDLDRMVTRTIAGFRSSSARARSGRGPVHVEDPGVHLDPMRLVKEPAELDRLRTAAEISALGHQAAMSATAAGVHEWEVEAVLEATFRLHGASGPAYGSIVASGDNATILHYRANDRQIQEGELLLIDAGAEWAMYCADITRTFPVSGRFSAEQLAVYELVLAAEEAAIAAALPGAPASAPHAAVVGVLSAGLVELGILEGPAERVEQEELYKPFFMHQTSHWLGLDVHDVGLYAHGGEPTPLAEGMVLTVEPGLYFMADDQRVPERFRGIGVRIEDDVEITADGNALLTRDVPVDPAEVEALVRG
jgi:Xaa-Pro aminopeptidase